MRLYALVFLFLTIVSIGCAAKINETYYLRSYDPATDVANYFRIRVSGTSWLGKTKYSVGFYDRQAVERLFGETTLQREFIASQLELIDAKSDEDLEKLAAALSASRAAIEQIRRENLQLALGVVAGLTSRLSIRIAGREEYAHLVQPLEQVRRIQGEAEMALRSQSSDLLLAAGRLREAQVILETIRIAVDSKVLVRFFDGAGNELDVTNKTLVIFVSSNISRFAEALRQLAESGEATENLLLTVLGSRIRESAATAEEIKRSDAGETALGARLAAILEAVEEIPADGEPGLDARKAELETLRKAILDGATVLAQSGARLKSAEEIRGFAKGLRDRP